MKVQKIARVFGVSFYLYLVLTLISLGVVIYSLGLEYWGAKFVPLLAGIIIGTLSAVGLAGELFPSLKPTGKKSVGQDNSAKTWLKYAKASSWLIGLVAGIYIVGFMLSAFLFLFGYMWSRKVKLPVNVICTAAMLAAIYVGFSVLLKVDLPQGFIFELLTK